MSHSTPGDFNRFLEKTLSPVPEHEPRDPGNANAASAAEANGYNEHPRIAILRTQVASLPVDEHYRASLLQSIDTYRDQIIERPHYESDEGWNDLEALQQVTLGDMIERHLRERANRDPGNASVPP